MSTDAVARVVADVRDERIKDLYRWQEILAEQSPPDRAMIDDVRRRAADTVVDATALYRDLVDRPRAVALYEHTIAPAWMSATICYENGHGNVIAMSTFATERERQGDGWIDKPEYATPGHVDWTACRWAMTSMIYAGGRGGRGPVPTMGPLFAFQYAIGEHGEPLDIHWHELASPGGASGLPGIQPRTVLGDTPDDGGLLTDETVPEWDMAMLTHLGALNFMSCRNVELVPARAPGGRAGARRLARTGVTVNTLQVRPMGRSSRSAPRSPGDTGLVPLSSVVGHFSHYGDCCPGRHAPRGLLFGKLQGKYWIPQHARGSAEAGEVQHTYELEP